MYSEGGAFTLLSIQTLDIINNSYSSYITFICCLFQYIVLLIFPILGYLKNKSNNIGKENINNGIYSVRDMFEIKFLLFVIFTNSFGFYGCLYSNIIFKYFVIESIIGLLCVFNLKLLNMRWITTNKNGKKCKNIDNIIDILLFIYDGLCEVAIIYIGFIVIYYLFVKQTFPN